MAEGQRLKAIKYARVYIETTTDFSLGGTDFSADYQLLAPYTGGGG